MDWLTARPIAHRGLHGPGVPENSLAAFDAAVAARYPIELDVQLSSDGIVMVFHDSDLARLTGVSRALGQCTADDLKGLSLLDTASTIPTLSEVLAAVDGAVPLLIEIKRRGGAGPLEQAVAELLDGYHGQFAVQSFNPYSIRWFARHRPAWSRGQLASDFHGDATLNRLEKIALKNMVLNPLTRPHFVAFEVSALPTWGTRLARRSGTPVIAWTVDSDLKRAKARQHADSMIFETIDPRA